MEIQVALVSVGGLEVLQPVRLDPNSEGLLHDLVQVHEPAAPEARVELFLAGRVAAHESLQGHGLVGREVVDVKPGIFLEPRHHVVDPLLEGLLLRDLVEGPQRSVLRLSERLSSTSEALSSSSNIVSASRIMARSRNPEP